MEKNNRTKKIIFTGMMGAIAFLLTFIFFPFTNFLKLDVADIPALVGTFVYGPIIGFAIEFLKNVLDYLFKGSDTGIPIGHIANLTAGLLYVLPIYFVYKKIPSKKGLLIACIIGVLSMTVFMSILNYYYYWPMYAKLSGLNPNSFGPMFDYLAKIIVPFNLLKGTITSIVFFVLYPRLKKIFK